jgi:hypothetical protein
VLAGLELKGLDLRIRHLLEGLVQQIDPRLLHVLAEPLPKVVQRAQLEVRFAQLVQTQCMPGLESEQKVLVHLFIRSAFPGFEKFQAGQLVDRRIPR